MGSPQWGGLHRACFSPLSGAWGESRGKGEKREQYQARGEGRKSKESYEGERKEGGRRKRNEAYGLREHTPGLSGSQLLGLGSVMWIYGNSLGRRNALCHIPAQQALIKLSCFPLPLLSQSLFLKKIPLISRSSSQLRYPMEHEQDDQPLVCRLVKPLTPGGPPAFLSIPRGTLAYSRSQFCTLPRAVWFLGVPTPLKDPAYSPSISLASFFLSTGTDGDCLVDVRVPGCCEHAHLSSGAVHSWTKWGMPSFLPGNENFIYLLYTICLFTFSHNSVIV